MKKFVMPEIEDMNDIVLEPVYASSGSVPTPPEKVTVEDGWDISTDYANHNSGSHSEVKIIGVHHGNNSGECVTMTFTMNNGYALDYVKDTGGYRVSNESATGFTITRVGHFNPNERFEFNIQIVVKNSPYHGAAGKTGQQYASDPLLLTACYIA